MNTAEIDAGTATGIRVLLVDDHQSILWGLVKLIEGEQPRFSIAGVAKSAADAVLQAAATKPDVIVLDIDLGLGKTGLDIIPDLLKACQAKILVLTGVRDPEIRDQAVLLGARGVVQKEEPAEIILSAIEKVHAGEAWLDRQTMGGLLTRLAGRREEKVSPEAAKIATLTRKEREIIGAIVREGGASNKRIADRLNISDHTLRNHLNSIYGKLGVSNRLELYVYANQHKLA